MDEILDLYINKCKMYIEFMLVQRQWSGISRDEIRMWINNFGKVDQKYSSIIYTLLTSIIYLSDQDIVRILKNGVSNLFNKEVLDAQINNNFQYSPKAIKNLVDELLKSTLFIPLLDQGAPFESGNQIARELVQKNIVNQHQVCVVEKFNELDWPVSKIVIIDDCVGSGKQFCDFWHKKAFIDKEHNILLKDYCLKKDIPVTYLFLIGYEKSINFIKTTCLGVDMYCMKVLKENNRIFDVNSYVWRNDVERTEADLFLTEVAKNTGFPARGYEGYDFALIMNQNVPDWTLPIFWKSRSNWEPLVRRKNSND